MRTAGYRRGDHDFRRCIACATVCSQWGTKMGSARSFATATTVCWPCHKKTQMVKCGACSREKEAHKFESALLEHHFHHGRKAVCMQCVECGYSPLDVRSYQCQGNGGHTCGHKAFHRKALENAKTRLTQTSHLHCLCQKHPSVRRMQNTFAPQ